MNLLDEKHTVSLITIDGVTTKIASARLTADDTLDGLRHEVERAAGRAANDVLSAFDAAFEQCEAIPGGTVVVETAYESGTVRVERRLAA